MMVWLHFFFLILIFDFRGQGREKGRETLIGCLCMHPDWGRTPQPRHVPWPESNGRPVGLLAGVQPTELHQLVWVHSSSVFLLYQTSNVFMCRSYKSVIKCRAFCLVFCTSHFYDLTLHFIESSKPNPNQISTSNGKPGAVNGAVGTTFQQQNPLLGRACESCYGECLPAELYFLTWGLSPVTCRQLCWRWWVGGMRGQHCVEGRIL